MIWLKRWYWAIKVHLFPHLERRARSRKRRMQAADDMLATAIMNLHETLEKK